VPVAPAAAPPSTGSRRLRGLPVLPLVGVLLGATMTAGAALALTGTPAAARAFVVPAAGPVPSANGTTTPTAPLQPVADGLVAAPVDRPPSRGSRPLRLVVPALHLDVPVVAVQIADGILAVPDNVHTIGWWSGGAAPGDRSGTVVLDGHVDDARQGVGALAAVARLPLGGSVTVLTSYGDVRYTVRARRTYPKDALPADLFNAAATPRLALITCSGTFDRTTGHYQDNLVVYATAT